MSSRALRLPLVGFVVLLAVTEGTGQQASCDLMSSRRVVSTQTDQAQVSFVSVPRFECTDGTRIEADSSVTYEASSFTELFGNVIFRDGQRELFADEAQYFSRVGRLQAQGSVRLRNLVDGSSLAGEDLVLLREGEDRAEEEVTVREGRPHARLVPTGGEDAVPYEVDADLIHLLGDRLFQARGRVDVTHESLELYGDSLEFQQDIGWLTLFENARILSQDTVAGDTLDVRGDTITMDLPGDQIEEIEARGRARLLAEDVDMRGPKIRLVFEEEELERVFAVRPGVEGDPTPVIEGADRSDSAFNPAQPQALAEDFVLTGDSIEADLTDGELEQVVATGAARGVSTARDSLNTEATDELIRSDWIEGDTITATFQPVSADPGVPSQDGAEGSEPRGREIDLLVARGQARSFYRSSPDSAAVGGATGPQDLELNYVIGDEVRLYMKDGEVERMEVDNRTGVYLQPRGRVAPTAAPAQPGDSIPVSSGPEDVPPGSSQTDRAPTADDNPPATNGGTP